MSKLLTISETETLHGLPSVIMAGFTWEDVSVVMLDRELFSETLSLINTNGWKPLEVELELEERT
jgi:hypothetical protein